MRAAWLLILCVVLYPLVAGAQTEPAVLKGRKALLIHNSAYDHLPALKQNTAFLPLANALGALGFRVTVKSDVTRSQFAEAVAGLVAESEPEGGSLVYFSGYVLQAGQNNFLLPRDFDPASDRNVGITAYSVEYVIDEFRQANQQLKIVAVEANWTDVLTPRADSSNLAAPAAGNPTSATTTVVALSSLQPARDNRFLFTSALASTLSRTGLTIDRVFASVQEEVARQSGGQQAPIAYTGAAAMRTYLTAPPPPPPARVEVREVERPLRAGDIYYNTNRERYVYIPPGTFLMGCVPATDSECRPEEKPQHEVELTEGFWMGETEVTVSFWDRFRMANRSYPKKSGQPTYPVTRVEWREAKAYCQWAGGRLPTEAEWEYAARAGTVNQAYPADLTTAREAANFDGTAGNDTFPTVAPVGHFDPNAWMLRDISGNVWEWVEDFFDADYYSRSPKTNPAGPPGGSYHVVRGGSWHSKAEEHLRLSYRKEQHAKGNNVGFRCVLPDTPQIRQRLKAH